MKIIGTTGGGYLVEATSAELLRISGRDDRVMRTIGSECRPNLANVGFEFDVGTIWDRLKQMRRWQGDMMGTVASLRALADLIDGKLDFVKEPEKPAEEKAGV